MTENEFYETFFPSLCARYSSVVKMTEADNSVADDWFYLLESVSIEDAKKALRMMVARDPQPYPNEVLSTFCTIAKTLRFQPINRVQSWTTTEQTFRCPDYCHDRGTITVYHPSAYQPIRDDAFEKRLLKEIVVACLCDAGRQHSEPREGKRFRPMLKLCRQTMCPVTKVHTDDQVLELVDFVQNHWKPRNFYDEFSGFA